MHNIDISRGFSAGGVCKIDGTCVEMDKEGKDLDIVSKEIIGGGLYVYVFILF